VFKKVTGNYCRILKGDNTVSRLSRAIYFGGITTMVKKFKDYYDLDCAVLLADKIKAVWPEFNKNDFVTMLKDGVNNRRFL